MSNGIHLTWNYFLPVISHETILKENCKIWWTFKTWYLFAIYQFNHMYHILLSISYLLSYYFWKSINKWRNGGDLKLRSFFLVIDLAHSANFTMATIEECGLQLLEHPPYSPDLAPSDFFLFPEMKRQLKGRRFEDRNEICAVTEEWLLAQPPHFYFEGLFKVKNRWQKCISLDGGWVEK